MRPGRWSKASIFWTHDFEDARIYAVIYDEAGRKLVRKLLTKVKPRRLKCVGSLSRCRGPPRLEAWFYVWAIRWLLPRRSLERELPECSQLFADPWQVLEEGDIRIKSCPVHRMLIALSVVLAAAMWKLFENWQAPVMALAASGGVGVLAIAQFARRGLLLRSDGLVVQHGEREVFCPWSLFNVPGNAVVEDEFEERLILPVAAAAIPGVEAREGGRVIAQGHDVKLGLFQFKPDNQVQLLCRYAVHTAELGELLLWLGRSLGEPVAKLSMAIPVSGAASEESAGGATIDHRGWLTLSLTRLSFPQVCCGCGLATSNSMDVRAVGRFGVLSGLGRASPLVLVAVPVCATCQRAARLSRYLGVTLGIVFGMVGGFAWGLLAGLDEVGTTCLALVGGMVGGFIGFAVGEKVGLPVRGARYDWRRRAVRLRFRNPLFAQQTLSLVQRMQAE